MDLVELDTGAAETLDRANSVENKSNQPIPRADELADQLRTVQQQIGQLELAAQEKKKPLWRQASLVLSIVSLAISASFSLYTQFDQSRQRKADATRQRAAALDSAVSDIVAIRMEDTKQMVALASSNLAAYRAWTNAATVKRATLIDTALNEIANLNGAVSPTTALTMGNGLIIDGRYPEAERLLKSGIEAADRSGTSSSALSSSLAQVYLFPGTKLYDPKRGPGSLLASYQFLSKPGGLLRPQH